AKRILLLIALSWAALFILDVVVAQLAGIKQVQVQITSTIVTIGISVLVITTVRKLVKSITPRIGLHVSAILSFGIIVLASLMATLSIMHVWNIDVEAVLISGGVAAIIIGIAMSTIVGNIFSGGLMLMTFPAKIGDSILIAGDNIHGTIRAISFMYLIVHSDT